MDEEMYEEEDDGLPRQYRQLAAHLQTGNPDFNNKLEAYLTANVAMRSALERTIHNSYQQQGSQYTPQYGMYQSPMMAHQFQQPMMGQQMPQQSIPHPQQNQNQYRSAPYPSPRPSHGRAASIASPSVKAEISPTAQSPVVSFDRRMSMPATPATSVSPTATHSPSQSTPRQRPSFPTGSFAQQFPNQQQYNTTSYEPSPSTFGPFSTALPNDAAGLLNTNFAFNSSSNELPTYDFSNQPSLPQTTSVNKSQHYPSFDGLNSTLAAPDMSYQPSNTEFFNEALGGVSGLGTPLGQTPGETDWASYVNFDEGFPSSQTSS